MKKETVIKNLRAEKSIIFSQFLKWDNLPNVFKLLKGKKVDCFFETKYNFMPGDFRVNMKFKSQDDHTDYLMYTANSGYANPQRIAIGTTVDDEVHLIYEEAPLTHGEIGFVLIPDAAYFDHLVQGFLPRKETHEFYPQIRGYELTSLDMDFINQALEARERIEKYIKGLVK